MQKDFLQIEKKHYLNNIKNLEKEKVRQIEEDFKVKFAYDAVYIGDSKVTLEQAFLLYREGIKDGISESEVKAFCNHIKAYEYILKSLPITEVSEDFIKDIHQILLEDILPGGLYRQVNVRLYGLHQPPDYIKVYDRMKKMIDHLNEEFKGDAIERAAYIVLTISKIYPFISGNGRLGRLLMNYYLLKDNYIPISIARENRREYFEAVDDFKVNKTMAKMVELIKKLLLERYNEINSYIE